MAQGKRVKTLFLEGDATVLNEDHWVNALASYTFQDNIRVIGCQVGIDVDIEDGAVNADQQFVIKAEVSKHGRPGQDGAIARCNYSQTWSAAIVAGGSVELTGPFTFPDGAGIDFDDGEAIYLHSYEKAVGTVAAVAVLWAIVYYVER